MWLLIDDKRSFQGTVVARTFEEGKNKILEGGWDTIAFDHDLGDEDPKKTGYDLMCLLEENPSLIPDNIVIVTDNPVGRKKMEVLKERLMRMKDNAGIA